MISHDLSAFEDDDKGITAEYYIAWTMPLFPLYNCVLQSLLSEQATTLI